MLTSNGLSLMSDHCPLEPNSYNILFYMEILSKGRELTVFIFEIALPGGIVNLLSKCVSLHELSKQIPLEMWKALGNYLYNELKRQTVVRSVPVKQCNLQSRINFLWKQWDLKEKKKVSQRGWDWALLVSGKTSMKVAHEGVKSEEALDQKWYLSMPWEGLKRRNMWT